MMSIAEHLSGETKANTHGLLWDVLFGQIFATSRYPTHMKVDKRC